MNQFVSLGYTYDQVLKIFLEFPSLYGYNIDTIKIKKEFYDAIGLCDIFVINPKSMIQGIDLSYARYMFYKDIGIDININNYRLLFVNEQVFMKRYKIDNDSLIWLYSRDIEVKKKIKNK